ncbi:hypothetical protein K505DRAFT_47955 [Melanomma pulvis-pyrius CBS 109.77]|uniref:DUF8035 domain-containing protein n=1 Tax=Melanomma pulvis-pyrius CBS 109.77 TaxID=1314802 RepID=A0A6A6X9G1_9PLEO|nr:hypothetical protein K505DRAFT_47955 [Melanomma pulvis-pyrius CBS 109.77]
MSRRYPTAELYEERQRDFYRDGNRSERSYDELDIELNRSHGDPRRSAPDFLREDYNRSSAGPLVVRERREEEVTRGPIRRRDVEQDALVIRSRPAPPPPASSVREVEREEISIRRGEGERRRPREVDRDETDITIRHREQSRPRPPPIEREVEREEISFRRGGGPPRPREVDIERDEVRFREREPPRREVERDEITFRHEHREESRHGRERDIEKDSITIRNRDRSLPAPRSSRGELVAREREEFIVRRREPSPPPREVIKDQIIIRRRERSPSPAPLPPPPPPPPEPEIRPPIIQEIITHHRHIDHGVERARSPTPPPPPPSPPRDDILDISIRRRESRGRAYDEDIIYERETTERRSRDMEITQTRGRSLSAPKRRFTAPADNEFGLEADYYNRKALERAYPGEALNGATKDWAIVDVPPGTNRVRMDGVGGGAQEISWQRYNGVRRSKFLSGEEEISTDFGMPTSGPPKAKAKDMWTEITKDLVLREAIDSMGYDCEETDYFFYVMEYLRYEDVLHLVEISDDIRRKRKSRIRQIEYEREEIRDRRPPGWDDRYYEHEVTYDRHRHRYR